MGRGSVSRFVGAMASVATAFFMVAGSSTPALAAAANPTLGAFDAAAPAANPYAGCVASVLVGSGIVFGSQAALVGTLDAVWSNLPPAVATVCKQAVDSRQPQVCVAPTIPAPCTGIGAAAVRQLTGLVTALPGNWKIVSDGLGCCGGYAETTLVSPTAGTPMATVAGTFNLPTNYCPAPSCATSPGLWASCDVFGCNPVTNMGINFVGRTPNGEPGVRAHYYTTDGNQHPIYDIEGIYGQSYWGTGCPAGVPSECNLTPGMNWQCLSPQGAAGANCGGQSISISMVFLSGPGGCAGCLAVGPTVAQQVSMDLVNSTLQWRANAAICPVNDCLRFDDSRLTYLDGAGRPTAVDYTSTPLPAAVVNVTSTNLGCLVGVNVNVTSAYCADAAGTVGAVVQTARAPVVLAPPPTVSASTAPAPNASGYAHGPVNVTITAVSASGPGVQSVTYSTSGAQVLPATVVPGSTAQFTIITDGQTGVDYFAIDVSGTSSATQHATVKVDNSPPSISCASPGAGWHLDNVTIACTATDSLSGLADPAQASFSLTTNVAPGTETATAASSSATVCDQVGNCATAGPFTGIRIDRAAPSISIRTPSGTYTSGQAVLADYSCSDSGSGVASCTGPVASGAPIDTLAVGAHTFTVTAVDAVGNQSQAVMNYTITAVRCDVRGEAVEDQKCNNEKHESAPPPPHQSAHAHKGLKSDEDFGNHENKKD